MSDNSDFDSQKRSHKKRTKTGWQLYCDYNGCDKSLQINSISNHTKRHIRGSAMSAMSMTVTFIYQYLYSKTHNREKHSIKTKRYTNSSSDGIEEDISYERSVDHRNTNMRRHPTVCLSAIGSGCEKKYRIEETTISSQIQAFGR